MLVEVVEVKRGAYTPTVIATGTVQPAKDVILTPQVGGEVIRLSDNFIPGSYVKRGEVLIRINPADYQNTLQLRKRDLAQARSDLSVEMGMQDVAREDYQAIGEELTIENQELVLRKPQLEAASANVEAAEAMVNQAELDLDRTTIRAPFDAHIISRSTNVGAQIPPGTQLGRLVGMDEYWVIANIPVSKVNWLSFADDSKSGSDVRILSKNWSAGQFRRGKLFRLVGALDAQTRLARAIISVSDPMNRKTPADSIPPLMIGTFVETQIEAREIPDVVRLSRDHLRQKETVWVLEDGKLRIRKVDIVFEDASYAYIRSGLADADLVVTTDLATVVEGSDLRTETNRPASQEGQKSEEN